MRLNLTLYKRFHYSEKQVIQRDNASAPSSQPGPKARRFVAGDRALSRAQMVQQSLVSKFFDIMENVLLEQG